jgi:glutaredoxin 3
MQRITMYATGTCPFCHRAEALLRRKGATDVELEVIRVDQQPQRRAEMTARSGRYTVPQIWIGEQHVGGCDDLHDLDAAGRLDALLAG